MSVNTVWRDQVGVMPLAVLGILITPSCNQEGKKHQIRNQYIVLIIGRIAGHSHMMTDHIVMH